MPDVAAERREKLRDWVGQLLQSLGDVATTEQNPISRISRGEAPFRRYSPPGDEEYNPNPQSLEDVIGSPQWSAKIRAEEEERKRQQGELPRY